MQEKGIKIIGTGLRRPRKDRRDFSRSKKFGSIAALSIPLTDFDVSTPVGIKDQQETDECTNFSLAGIFEDAGGKAFSPHFTFAQTKKLEGDWRTYGADPRDAMAAAKGSGFLLEASSPYNLQNRDRNFLANWNNWSPSYTQIAQVNKTGSYFKVDGQKDLFDSIRSVLWEYSANGTKRGIFVGAEWQSAWTNSPDGVITDASMPETDKPHAFKALGQKIINGIPYIKMQLSNGTSIGAGGYYYFSRPVVNKLMFAYAFENVDPKEERSNQWSFLAWAYHFLQGLLGK